jgi:tetratricopeptide (TPR) repeat protein
MIAAAMLAGEWDTAEQWALLIPQYRAFVEGSPPHRSLNHFQVSLFRGLCVLMRGRSEQSLEDLKRARELDGTSYLPLYLSGRAMLSLGRRQEARRAFVAACQRLNPSLAVAQWKSVLGTQ